MNHSSRSFVVIAHTFFIYTRVEKVVKNIRGHLSSFHVFFLSNGPKIGQKSAFFVILCNFPVVSFLVHSGL